MLFKLVDIVDTFPDMLFKWLDIVNTFPDMLFKWLDIVVILLLDVLNERPTIINASSKSVILALAFFKLLDIVVILLSTVL